MSREIKFRIFNKHCQRMIYDTKMAMLDMFENSFVTEDEHRYLMQYTGLKDKNSKEIYEGDIITDKGIRGVIKWIPEHCGFLIHEEMGYTFINAGNAPETNYEIIGNIYENPELLEATA